MIGIAALCIRRGVTVRSSANTELGVLVSERFPIAVAPSAKGYCAVWWRVRGLKRAFKSTGLLIMLVGSPLCCLPLVTMWKSDAIRMHWYSLLCR